MISFDSWKLVDLQSSSAIIYKMTLTVLLLTTIQVLLSCNVDSTSITLPHDNLTIVPSEYNHWYMILINMYFELYPYDKY